MRVFKNKTFTRFARKERISDDALRKVVQLAENGLIDADLGGGIIKQRMARAGGGKSGGYRTVMIFRAGKRAAFVYGFGKNERDNIAVEELSAFRLLARSLLAYSDDDLDNATGYGASTEITDDG